MGNFWKYKGYLNYDGSDLLSAKQFILTGIILVVIIALAILLRKTKENKVTIFLRIISILVPLTDTIKFHWETHYDILFGYGINWGGNLPLYTCSLFMFTLPFAAWCKGKPREIALGFLTTLGIIAGLSNFIYLNILGSYPLFHYASFQSIFYHGMMVFTGLFLLTTKYVKIKAINIIYSMITIFIFSLIAIPITYNIYFTTNNGCDYMLYTRGAGLPIIGDLATKLGEKNLLSLYTLFMMTIGYGFASTVAYGLEKLIVLVKMLFLN